MAKADYKHSKSTTDLDIKDFWQTPIELYEYLNARFHFVCDVAASDHNHLHLNYLTESYNSLINGWAHLRGGYAFCNPPYSGILPWIEKAKEAKEKGVGTVMLLPSDTSTTWFKKLIIFASEVTFITGGRISFVNAVTKKPVKGNNKGSLFAVFHPHHSAPCHIFGIERDVIFETYKKIKDTLPDPAVSAVWPKEVNRIFNLVASEAALTIDLKVKVKQNINKMMMNQMPMAQIEHAAQILVNRMETKA